MINRQRFGHGKTFDRDRSLSKSECLVNFVKNATLSIDFIGSFRLPCLGLELRQVETYIIWFSKADQRTIFDVEFEAVQITL